MSITIIVILILLGFLLFGVEFLIIPGITIAGISAVLLISGSIFAAYYFHGTSAGNYVLLGTGLGIIGFFIFVLKSKTWKRFGLKSEINGKVGVLEKDLVNIGDSGETVSRLAPIGKAIFNEKIFEVRSDGSYIDAQKGIQVIRIEGNKIFVELK